MTGPLAALEVRLGHVFARPALLVEALTHPSYLNEHPDAGPHNQRLEFLGDAVLGQILTTELFHAFPGEPEGALSRRRSVLNNGRTLAELALGLGLDTALRLGGSENTPEGRTRPSSLEDAFEALVGALYLDAGPDTTRARVLSIYGPLHERLATGLVTDNPKGRLQELVQPIHGNTALRYETVQSGGVDHAKEYVSTLYLAERPLGTGRGLSKKTAEEAAAREALHAHALGGVI
ncbi:ribonuclease III [bacterium]|jgi:ribonuclease-3|nr:ribonuclease III [bacterium]